MKLYIFKKRIWTSLERFLLVLSVILALYGIYQAAFSDDKHNQDLFGIWHSDYRYWSNAGLHEVIGTTEFFENGNYNFIGKMILTENNKQFSISHNLQVSGEWETDGEHLFTKVIDIKSFFIPKESFSKTISNGELLLKKKQFAIEALITKGSTERYTIHSIQESSIVLSSIDPHGKNLEIKMTKKNKRFEY